MDRLHTIPTPTLILVVDYDECDPSLSRTMHDKIEASKLVILPYSGHMNFEDQPELWHKIVEEFRSSSRPIG